MIRETTRSEPAASAPTLKRTGLLQVRATDGFAGAIVPQRNACHCQCYLNVCRLLLFLYLEAAQAGRSLGVIEDAWWKASY